MIDDSVIAAVVLGMVAVAARIWWLARRRRDERDDLERPSRPIQSVQQERPRPPEPQVPELNLRHLAALARHLKQCDVCRDALRAREPGALCAKGRELAGG